EEYRLMKWPLDLNSTKTMEGRNKIFDWFSREIVPLGDIGTCILMVGNLLHEDSLVMRLKKLIDKKELKGMYHWFPLLDAEGKCLWPGKFDTQEKIEDLRHSVANELAWRQEYLLEIISDTTRVIFPEWIKTYKELPKGKASRIVVGVDLAISESKTADYTAMVAMKIYGSGKNAVAYVLPNHVHKRLPFPDVVEAARSLSAALRPLGSRRPKFMVESNSFQKLYADAFAQAGCLVEGVKNMSDKRSRVALTSHHVSEGKILFPEQGAELLVTQLTGLGRENHDDLADAYAMAAAEFIQLMNVPTPSIRFITWDQFLR
ncbi:MAG: phage terminase large subunit, partial [Ktedonobacteraceae bacterium]